MDKARIVDMANELAASGPINAQKLIATHDVIVAVWQDQSEPDGVGQLVVKGDRALLTIVAEAGAKAMTIAAIPCACLEMAVALKEEPGEPNAYN